MYPAVSPVTDIPGYNYKEGELLLVQHCTTIFKPFQARSKGTVWKKLIQSSLTKHLLHSRTFSDCMERRFNARPTQLANTIPHKCCSHSLAHRECLLPQSPSKDPDFG
ncbi:hypothetical protein V6N13_051322 [Hibiscus sabdariffa]|uniref:Uncharacterized protein n=1 Tax=Hibiscus sabdariffa TaxID=183260 RepID=A0ABR2T3B9_9ROSI